MISLKNIKTVITELSKKIQKLSSDRNEVHKLAKYIEYLLEITQNNQKLENNTFNLSFKKEYDFYKSYDLDILDSEFEYLATTKTNNNIIYDALTITINGWDTHLIQKYRIYHDLYQMQKNENDIFQIISKDLEKFFNELNQNIINKKAENKNL